VLALIGFTAVIAQVLLMRELIVAFQGNEITLGVMLACWLLWTAMGSAVVDRLTRRLASPRSLVAGLQTAVALVLPFTVAAVRGGRSLLHAVPGELPGPGTIFVASAVSLSLVCLLSGWLFAAGSRLYSQERRASLETATSAVYVLEALGSGIGGLLVSLLLIRSHCGLEIALLVALLNLAAAAGLAIRRRLPRAIMLGAMAAGAAVFVAPIAQPGPGGQRPTLSARLQQRLDQWAFQRTWPGYRLLRTRDTPYGRLDLAEREGTRTVYENGLALVNLPDPTEAEESVHYALLEHPAPASLLLIGGGANGSLAEAVRHPGVTRVDYVELDPAILDLARDLLRPSLTPDSGPRVRLHSTDGRLFLKTTDSRFDVIVVNVPDPQTAQLNRFYTVEFFREAARKLSPAGVLSFHLSASENYIGSELAEFLRCVNATVRSVFSEVAVLPGDNVHFFAATRPGLLARDSDELLGRLRARRLETLYVREYYIPFRMMPDRVLDLESQIAPRAGTPINQDFAPIAYYFDVVLWSAQFDASYRRIFQAITHVRFGWLAAGLALAVAVAAVLLARPFSGRNSRAAATAPRAAAFCVAAMGFTLIGLELMLLLAFQAVYGYVYQQLAVVIGCFMAGMALGSWRAMRARKGGTGVPACAPAGCQESELRRQCLCRLAGLQLAVALAPSLLYLVFLLLARAAGALSLALASYVVFPALGLFCGMLGGYQFPVASRIYFTPEETPPASGLQPPASSLQSPASSLQSPASSPNIGALYAVDLAGACLGGILLSAWLVPVFGLLRTGLLMGVLNLGPAALAAFCARQAAGARAAP
jgi:spermidine synthase